MAGLVLTLASSDESEARRVNDVVEQRGHSTARLDLSWFPRHATVTTELGPRGWQGCIATPEGKIALEDIVAVHSRRCPPFGFPAGMSEPEHRFAMVEARFGLGGILNSLPARWVSHPSAEADAEYKPVQLAAAARAGFAVPTTWMGNSPDAARAFINGRPGGAVYKATMHKILSEQDEVKLIYTSPADPEQVDDRISATMHQFQARVNGARDVRALVSTTRGEAVEIIYRDGRPRLDYRAHYDTVAYQRTTLAPEVIERCRRMLTGLGLRMGVFDFALTPTGETLFYEVNPGGQWAWLAEETGAPMAELVADELLGDSQ